MKAILTKYHGPGMKGSAIWAKTSDGLSARVEYDHALNADANHAEAAKKLCAKLDWHGVLVMGSLGDSERVFVWAEVVYGNKELLNGIEVR